MGNLVFSSMQQRVLLGQHGRPTRAYVEHLDRPTETVEARHRSSVAHLYESEDGASLIVATSVGPVAFEDAVDLGPGGRHLHAYSADGVYPIFPMVFPRDRLDDLLHRRLMPEDYSAARRAAEELAERVAAEAAAPTP